MAEKSTIARPYAQAAFEVAQQQGKLKDWSEMLQWLAAVAADKSVHSLLGNPEVSQDALVKLFVEICGDKLNQQGQNFVRLLTAVRALCVVLAFLLPCEHHNDACADSGGARACCHRP